MQTFLPYPSFKVSAKVLDYRRLGKQRLEAVQILKALTLDNYGWKNHPVTKMWTGFESSLKVYYNIVLQEWIDRGYNNSMPFLELDNIIIYPTWLGDYELHLAYRKTLLFKNPEHYSSFGWGQVPTEKPIINYPTPIVNP